MNQNLRITYVTNNSYKAEYELEDNPDKNGYDLLYDKYLFKRQRINKDFSINWLCKSKKSAICSASITIDRTGAIIRSNLVHSIDKPHIADDLTVVARDFTHTIYAIYAIYAR